VTTTGMAAGAERHELGGREGLGPTGGPITIMLRIGHLAVLLAVAVISAEHR